MENRNGLLKNSTQDPVTEMVSRYPRVLVIKAAFELLKDGRKLIEDDLEKIVEVYLGDT